jgi:hypothetical protein
MMKMRMKLHHIWSDGLDHSTRYKNKYIYIYIGMYINLCQKIYKNIENKPGSAPGSYMDDEKFGIPHCIQFQDKLDESIY